MLVVDLGHVLGRHADLDHLDPVAAPPAPVPDAAAAG
jgi:hypothetical protein